MTIESVCLYFWVEGQTYNLKKKEVSDEKIRIISDCDLYRNAFALGYGTLAGCSRIGETELRKFPTGTYISLRADGTVEDGG
jgi:hypothetical protein